MWHNTVEKKQRLEIHCLLCITPHPSNGLWIDETLTAVDICACFSFYSERVNKLAKQWKGCRKHKARTGLNHGSWHWFSMHHVSSTGNRTEAGCGNGLRMTLIVVYIIKPRFGSCPAPWRNSLHLVTNKSSGRSTARHPLNVRSSLQCGNTRKVGMPCVGHIQITGVFITGKSHRSPFIFLSF